MSTFKQNCPGCDRSLELPEDSKGRLGKCPVCEVTFTIGAVDDALDANLMPLEDSPSDGDVETHNEQDLSLSARAESIPISSQTLHTNAPALEVTVCEIEDVLSTALAIFRARLLASILPVLIAFVVVGLAVALPLYIFIDLYVGGSRKTAVFGMIVVSPFSCVASAFICLFVARAQLAVARDEESSLLDTAPSVHVFLRGLVVSLVMFIAVAGVCISAYAVTSTIDSTGAVVLARILKLVAVFTTISLGFMLVWCTWSWMYVCGDGKGTASGSIRAALAITQENKLTSFLLVLISLVLALTGTLMCLIGHLLTAPLTLLMFAVGYLKMTGQPLADPRAGPNQNQRL